MLLGHRDERRHRRPPTVVLGGVIDRLDVVAEVAIEGQREAEIKKEGGDNPRPEFSQLKQEEREEEKVENENVGVSVE